MADFITLIGTIQGGVLEADLDREVRAITRKVMETGKKGKIALVITLDHAGSGRVEVSGQVKLTTPVENRESALFYVTPDGSLSRRDPQQQELPGLRVLEGGAE
jgi:hypothetical protein